MILWNTNFNARKMNKKPKNGIDDPSRDGADSTKTTGKNKIRQEGGGGTFLFVLLLAIAGGISIGWYFNKISSVKNIEVSGNYYTDAAQVITVSGITLDISPDSISYIDAIQQIETLPYVKEASLRMSPSGKLRVHLEERTPLGMIIQGSQRYYFDEDGVVLPVMPGKTIDVPLIYGLAVGTGTDTLRTKEFDEMRDFLMAASRDMIAISTLSEIAWSKQEGVVALSNENGIRIVFGNDNFEKSIENWSMFYTQVIGIRGPQNFTSVDLRYSGQIITRES